MRTAAAALFLAAALPALSQAQQTPMPIRFQPEPDFESIVDRTVEAMRPSDAFAASECRVVDAKFFKKVDLAQAEQLLAPCVRALTARYGADVSVRRGTISDQGRVNAQVEVLILGVPSSLPATSPLLRDLNHGLALRKNMLLGHPAVVKRVDQAVSAESDNPAQTALDSCMMPAVLRRIDSGADFIRFYGGCLRQTRALQIVELRPWAGHQLGVMVLTKAGRPVAEALTTSVSVVASNGPVTVDLVAYTEPVLRP